MWIRDDRLDAYNPPRLGWRVRVAAAVKEYGDHPALCGYYLVDEPDAARFADLAALVHRLRSAGAGNGSPTSISTRATWRRSTWGRRPTTSTSSAS